MRMSEQTKIMLEQTEKIKFRINQKLHSHNPLLDVKFCENLNKDMLFYDEDDEYVPRAVQNRRLIAGLWSDVKMQQIAQIERWSGRLEPSYHAIALRRAESTSALRCDGFSHALGCGKIST